MAKVKNFKLDFFKKRATIKAESKGAVADYYQVFVPMTLVAFLIIAIPVGVAFLFKNLIVQISLWSFAFVMLNYLIYGYLYSQINLANDIMPKMSDLFVGFKHFFKVFFFIIYILIVLAFCSVLAILPLFVLKTLPNWLNICLIVISFVPTLLFVICHFPVYFVLVENPKMKYSQMLTTSRNLTKEKRWDFIVMLLSFIPKNILFLFTILIGQLWFIPFKLQCISRFYLDLKAEI